MFWCMSGSLALNTAEKRVAHIRFTHGLKTPDCLQAASCLQQGSDHVFTSGDAAFKRVVGLHVKLLE